MKNFIYSYTKYVCTKLATVQFLFTAHPTIGSERKTFQRDCKIAQ